jgi:plasmid stabilization system protein ParE
MSRYVLTAEAQEDLRQIRDYLLKEADFRAARHVMISIVTAFQLERRARGTGAKILVHAKSFASGLCFLI